MSATQSYYEGSTEQRVPFYGRTLLRIGGLLVLLYLAFSQLLLV